jgi:hypothetical protein
LEGAAMNELPPSLAVVPNIRWDKQTLEQLQAERAYWQATVDAAEGCGAAPIAAIEFRDACDAWIKRREAGR